MIKGIVKCVDIIRHEPFFEEPRIEVTVLMDGLTDRELEVLDRAIGRRYMILEGSEG